MTGAKNAVRVTWVGSRQGSSICMKIDIYIDKFSYQTATDALLLELLGVDFLVLCTLCSSSCASSPTPRQLTANGTTWVIHLGGCILGLYPMQSQEWFVTPAGGCQLIPAAQPSCGGSVACHPVCCLAFTPVHLGTHRHYTCRVLS